MSSSQDQSLLYTLAILVIGAVIAAAVYQHLYPKAANFLGPIIRQKILAIWSYCIDGRRSIRKEWEERGRVENWESITTVQGMWEWDRKGSNQNVRCYGIPFSRLASFVPMCEANLRFEPRRSYNFNEWKTGNIASQLPPVEDMEIYGGLGEYICVVSGKKEPDGKVLIKSVKKTTVKELNKFKKSIPAKHESEYRAKKMDLKIFFNPFSQVILPAGFVVIGCQDYHPASHRALATPAS